MGQLLGTGHQREEPLTNQQIAFLKMVEHNLRESNKARLNGEMKFIAMLREGNVMDAYKIIKSREHK